jgi:protein-L-isoaspartate(D-aspartate) O-methyltransferase
LARYAPYDVIVVTGSLPILPHAFLEQLLPGGRMFVILGDPPVMTAQLVTCETAGAYSPLDLFETNLAPLDKALQPERFQF